MRKLVINIDSKTTEEKDLSPEEVSLRQAEEAAWTPPTEEQQISRWLAENKYAAALIMGLNRPSSDPLHIPVNAGLDNPAIIGKIRDSLNG